MYDCQKTRERINELTGNDEDKHLLDELQQCESCREEYASLQSTLRLADQALRSAAPAENFWPPYHARLRQRLASSAQVDARTNSAVRSGVLASLLFFFARSVRIPVPIAAMLLLVFGATIVFAMRSRRATVVTLPSTIVTRTVEVPVPY